ncbi:molybdate ABC transporter substrate-binding protein [Sphingomonas sp. TF3]|jgi:molybdate transport system substrate-binding protein|uniref:molybdate ABC transporter substrate-binding protein n=2 Tax=unclassified Sphingomonas TaxID=196159 RepID=UPI000F883940|nr:molybdate ABC transporter substrate-binding protein [Sphingomonas sp. TF3]RUN76449.1 molybdate ABC transporter substrate-binding protein [Sphingomonas sp. TF3]
MKRLLLLLLFLTGIAPAVARPQSQGPLVLAAASLQEAMTAAGHAWAAQGHAEPVLSFAASSALARQITAGAPADLFVSADQAWMDDVAAKGLLVQGTRAPFLGNRLVIVAAVGNPVKVPLASAALVRLLAAGPLAMADPDSVPAGRYGKAALIALGVWAQVQPHVVAGDSVRAALALVERGAAPLGIVYATDARASSAVRIAGVFPPRSYPPITYPLARLKSSTNREAEGFRRFLLSRSGRAIFARFGFSAR